jgi:major membrane immunogen (membrane-anchored lipoprotein)
MKTKNYLIPCIVGLSLLTFSFQKGETEKVSFSMLSDTSSNYMDGTYQGQSRASYTSEPFWGHIQISVENGSFTDIQFCIRDSSSHEAVDSVYGVIHYAGNPLYMQQCVNDGRGIETYPQELLESQNLDKVDAISGATWSYNIFKASVKTALKDAEIPSQIEDNRNKEDKTSVRILPNPFKTAIHLEYSLIKPEYVNLCIYDNLGNLVKQLVDQQQPAGRYSIEWDDCPIAGIYYSCLRMDNRVFCSKLVKIAE